jgi:quercetin dioxygenase-like cupin family protein
MYKTSRSETPFDPTIPERPGWEGMYVHWLADRDHAGTATTVFNVTQFPPRRSHELHRHPHAEEFFFVLEGGGLHLTDDQPVELVAGDLVFIPRGEWHGFANHTDAPALAVTVMGGVSHYADAGYEVHPQQPEAIAGTTRGGAPSAPR